MARMLKEIPVGSTFTVRIVEPLSGGFMGIDKRTTGKGPKKGGYGSGKETIRFKADGTASIQAADDQDALVSWGVNAINSLLDVFMGINDQELATQVIIIVISMLAIDHLFNIRTMHTINYRFGNWEHPVTIRWTLPRR